MEDDAVELQFWLSLGKSVLAGVLLGAAALYVTVWTRPEAHGWSVSLVLLAGFIVGAVLERVTRY